MTSHRLALILAGGLAVAAIAFTMILDHAAMVAAPMVMIMLLGTYALGLGVGRLLLKRGG